MVKCPKKKIQEEPSDFCEAPLHYSWDICQNWEQFGFHSVQGPMYPLFEYQDKCIEHQDAEVPVVSYFTEAVGDIFREVSKWQQGYASEEYIREKLDRRLGSINDWNRMDEQEKQQFITEEKRQVLREFEKKVDTFLKLVRVNSLHPLVPMCSGYENIRQVQEKSVWMLKSLIDWGLDKQSTPEIKVEINQYIRTIKQLLEIE